MELENITVLDFGAKWCSVCKAIEPILDQLEKEFGFKLRKIDVDEDVDIMEDYIIRSIPTLIFIKDGVEVGRQIGSTTKENLIKKLKSL